MTETIDHLHRLYAETDDPWDFANSPYEQQKFAATRDALSRGRYDSALEIGCGNGALAAHLAPRCARYTGMDAVERAVIAARKRVPTARFVHACYPCPLPEGEYDLIVLSEFLYFLTPEDIAHLAHDLADTAPRAEILCITFLGDTEQMLQGAEALELFRAAMQRHVTLVPVEQTDGYRIDRGVMGSAAS